MQSPLRRVPLHWFRACQSQICSSCPCSSCPCGGKHRILLKCFWMFVYIFCGLPLRCLKRASGRKLALCSGPGLPSPPNSCSILKLCNPHQGKPSCTDSCPCSSCPGGGTHRIHMKLSHYFTTVFESSSIFVALYSDPDLPSPPKPSPDPKKVKKTFKKWQHQLKHNICSSLIYKSAN